MDLPLVLKQVHRDSVTATTPAPVDVSPTLWLASKDAARRRLSTAASLLAEEVQHLRAQLAHDHRPATGDRCPTCGTAYPCPVVQEFHLNDTIDTRLTG